MNVLVLGGYGAIGSLIVDQLRAAGDIAWAAGRDATRADRPLDLHRLDAESVRSAVADVDVVVNAAGVEDPALAGLFLEQAVGFVDITAASPYVAALERLEPPAPLLLSVGLAPGLTNLLAVAVHEAAPGPVDLALVLGTGERYGPAAVAWSSNLLGRRFADPADAKVIRNYSRPTRFDLPRRGRRRLLRADFSEQHTLTRDLGVAVRTHFGLNSRLATASLAGLTWIPGGSGLSRHLHLPGSDRWLALARGADGTIRWASGRPQAHATATLTVLAVRAMPRLGPGVHHLHRVVSIDDVPTDACLHIS
jgi:saccharopine dehydrogenase-like NADP-dependent oxidoreductase